MDGAELMRKIVAGFEKSDLKPLLDALHEDIVWKTANRHDGPFRFKGDYKGRAGVLEVISQIAMAYTFHHYKPREIIGSGDVVWGLFDVSLSFDQKGKAEPAKPMHLEIALRWQLKDGKIIEHQGFFDTAYLLAQQGLIPTMPAQP